MSDQKYKMDIDFDELTLGEIGFIERKTGKNITEMQAGGMSSDMIRCLVMLAAKRSGNTLTWDETENIKIGQLEQSEEDDGE